MAWENTGELSQSRDIKYVEFAARTNTEILKGTKQRQSRPIPAVGQWVTMLRSQPAYRPFAAHAKHPYDRTGSLRDQADLGCKCVKVRLADRSINGRSCEDHTKSLKLPSFNRNKSIFTGEQRSSSGPVKCRALPLSSVVLRQIPCLTITRARFR